jgi:hypothetical protein
MIGRRLCWSTSMAADSGDTSTASVVAGDDWAGRLMLDRIGNAFANVDAQCGRMYRGQVVTVQAAPPFR